MIREEADAMGATSLNAVFQELATTGALFRRLAREYKTTELGLITMLENQQKLKEIHAAKKARGTGDTSGTPLDNTTHEG